MNEVEIMAKFVMTSVARAFVVSSSDVDRTVKRPATSQNQNFKVEQIRCTDQGIETVDKMRCVLLNH